MKIDDIDEVKEFLENVKYFFGYIDSEKAQLEKELTNKELERDDWLHEIELSKLNAIERGKVYSNLEKVLVERRILKDKIDFINTIKGYASKFIAKGVCVETNLALENIQRLEENRENRKYTARIVKNLKCAKKEKK